MNRTGLSGNRGVLLLVMAGVAVVGGLLWTIWGWNPRATLSGTNFYFWFLLCMCGEMLRTSSSGKATATMAACAHIASLLVLQRPEAMAVVGISSLVAGRLVHRRAWAQSAFEAGALMCVVALGRIVFDALAPDGWRPSSLVAAGHYVPALAAAAVYFVGTFAARFGWTTVEEGALSGAQVGFEFLSAGVLLSLGLLLAIQFKLAGAIGAMIVAIPVVVARYGLESFAQTGGRQSSYHERPRAAA